MRILGFDGLASRWHCSWHGQCEMHHIFARTGHAHSGQNRRPRQGAHQGAGHWIPGGFDGLASKVVLLLASGNQAGLRGVSCLSRTKPILTGEQGRRLRQGAYQGAPALLRA